MNNGRVNIMGENNVDRFLLYERVAPKKLLTILTLVGNFQSNNLSKHFSQQKILNFYNKK